MTDGFQFPYQPPTELKFPPGNHRPSLPADKYQPTPIISSRRFICLKYDNGSEIKQLHRITLADDTISEVHSGLAHYSQLTLDIPAFLSLSPEEAKPYLEMWLSNLDAKFYREEISQLILEWIL